MCMCLCSGFARAVFGREEEEPPTGLQTSLTVDRIEPSYINDAIENNSMLTVAHATNAASCIDGL